MRQKTCTQEEFGLLEGLVFPKCRCSLSQAPPNTQLAEWCFSPDGTDCFWYIYCLEKKYPCEARGSGYALTHAENFCNLHFIRSSNFTAEGRNWINAIRKCFQVALVPMMRPWESPSCDEIRQKAFASHTPCYQEPSICDLDCRDWAEVFWNSPMFFLL